MQIQEITAMKNGKIKVLMEGHVQFVLYRSEARRFELKEGADLSDDQWQEIKTEILLKRAKRRAMHLLEKMDRTEKQLRDKLREGGYPQDVTEDAVAYVKSYHYIDDERYARNFVRCQQEKKSVLQMKMDLLKKGIASDLIETALEEEAETSPEELIEKLLRKRNYDPNTADLKERQRVYQFLMRKGFRSDEICRCMKLYAEL